MPFKIWPRVLQRLPVPTAKMSLFCPSNLSESIFRQSFFTIGSVVFLISTEEAIDTSKGCVGMKEEK